MWSEASTPAPEPDAEMAELTERVQRLDARLIQFEQQLRSRPDPPPEAAAAVPDTSDEAAPEPSTDATQAHEEPGSIPEASQRCQPCSTTRHAAPWGQAHQG
jgi:hypothetical protein